MTARVESLEGQFEERCDVYEPGVVPVQRAMWWRLALAAVLLAIILVLAATVLIYSQQEDAPMQVVPKDIVA